MQPDDLDHLTRRILDTPLTGLRRIIALAGPPASGKSTQAEALKDALVQAGERAVVVPMDGFHLDNRILDARGLRARKGAPETFDAGGFARLITALQSDETVYYPRFDRARDIAISGAQCLTAGTTTVIVEGNYLLLDRPIWRDLAPHWALSIRLDVPSDEIERRLMRRWLDLDHSVAEARRRTHENDLPNAITVNTESLPADVVLRIG